MFLFNICKVYSSHHVEQNPVHKGRGEVLLWLASVARRRQMLTKRQHASHRHPTMLDRLCCSEQLRSWRRHHHWVHACRMSLLSLIHRLSNPSSRSKTPGTERHEHPTRISLLLDSRTSSTTKSSLVSSSAPEPRHGTVWLSSVEMVFDAPSIPGSSSTR
jgi:hypothetical protein